MTLPAHLSRLREPPGTYSPEQLRGFLQEAQQAGDQAAQGYTLLSLALAERELGECSESLLHAQAAAELFGQLGDRTGAAQAQMHLGASLFRLGEFTAALDQLYTVIQYYEEAQDRSGLIGAYMSMGSAFAELADYEEALRHFREAQALLDDGTPPQRALMLRTNIFGALIYLERFSEAEELGQALSAQAVKLRQPALLAAVDGLWATLRQLQGRDAEALELHGRSEALFAEVGLLQRATFYTSRRAQLMAVHDPAAALELLLSRLPEVLGRPVLEFPFREQLALIYKQTGQYREALEQHEIFHRLTRELEGRTARQRAQAARTAQAMRARVQHLEQAVALDHLTGVFTRGRLESELAAAAAQHQHTGEPVTVALADVDHFKRVNDRFGHAVGDEVLRSFAVLLRAQVRERDVVGRYGGEEFLIVLPGTPLERAQEALERVCGAVRGHDWSALHPELRVTVSIGAQSVRDSAAQALAEADAALYAAKNGGRDCVRLYVPPT